MNYMFLGNPLTTIEKSLLITLPMNRDPKEKEFGISFGTRNRSRKKVLKELEKCDLMCKICHNIYHNGEY